MAKIYIITDPDGYPLIWRVYDVLESVRLYEDGLVACEHLTLAIKLGYGTEFALVQRDSYAAAVQYVNALVKERIWYHLFSLSYGYNDKYVGREP